MNRLLSRAAIALALLLAGCGPSADEISTGAEPTLLVAGAPASMRAPVDLALARGFDEAEGATVDLRSDGDAHELLTTGRVDAAIVGVDELRPPLVAVMAFVQGDQAGRARKPGEPERPGVLLAVTRDTLADRRAEVRALVRTIQRGMTEAAADPESAVTAALDADETLDRTELTAELERVAPAFTAGAAAPGALDADQLRAWARWAGKDVAADASFARPISRD